MLGLSARMPTDDDRPTSSSNDERKLNLLVDAMCRASTPDERSHLSGELRNAVDSIKDVGEHNVQAFESDHAHERGPAVAALVRRLQSMLTSKESLHRLAGIAGITSLINTDSESIHAKIQRTSNAIRVLYNTHVTDIPTARAAARLVGDFAQLNNPMSDRAVEAVLRNAINLIGTGVLHSDTHPQLSMDRARATMVVAELAAQQRVPTPIFLYQDTLRRDMWLVICDKDPFVRDQGVRGLRAILRTLAIRTPKPVAEGAIRDAMDVIRATLAPDSLEDVSNKISWTLPQRTVFAIHGSLVMLASLLGTKETKHFMLAFSSELCSLALPYQTWNERKVRQAVADILPLLVKLDQNEFATRFLDTVHTSTLKLIQDPKFPAEERGRSLLSLALIAEQMPANIDNSRLLSDMLKECRRALKHTPSVNASMKIPEAVVINTISHLAKASRGSPVLERELRAGLLYDMFETNFTNSLVTAVDEVGRAVSSFEEPVRERLVHLIAATLKRRLPNKKYAISRDSADLQDAGRSGSTVSVTRTDSLASLTSHTNRGPRRRRRGPVAPLPESTEEEQRCEDTGLVRQLSARNFFQQVPISEELHRIDGSCALTSTSNGAGLDCAIGDHAKVASPSSPQPESLAILESDDGATTDQDNSPCVALKAIVSYEFTGMRVEDFCSFTNEFVIGYVEYNRVKVRALAVQASAKLMVAAAEKWSAEQLYRRDVTQIRREVHSTLAQILSIAVADPSTDVRYVAIRALDHPIFFPHLLQPEMLSKLCLCFHDESLAMRASALSLAGRLSQGNTAHALPALRCYFMHLMRVLRCDGDHFSRDRREATELVYTLVHDGKDLVLPFTGALVQALLTRLQEAQHGNDTSLALPVLMTIAEMGGTMSKIDLSAYQEEMVPLLVMSVLGAQGADSLYQKAALGALTAFVQNTGFVIKPHVVHSALLPELLQILRSESDASVRILAEKLLGSLGAVDRVDNKYSVIPEYGGRNRSSGDRLSSQGSPGRSLSRREHANSTVGIHWGSSGPNRTGQASVATRQRAGGLQQYRHTGPFRTVSTQGDMEVARLKGPGDFKVTRSGKLGSFRSAGGNASEDLQTVSVSLAFFEMGGTGLMNRIADYEPCWAVDTFPRDTLVEVLEHPYTASTEYFPSAALDGLHTIILNPRLRLQHREACQAIVNILRSVGPKCASFLPEVVPRMLWLLEHSGSRDSPHTAGFTLLQQHVMQRLGDIVTIAGHNYMPFAFDTVLLTWQYLRLGKNSPACVTGICDILSRLRRALGDEFRPILATVLPLLLESLAQDESSDGSIAIAVLETLEAFGPLMEGYIEIVLISLTKLLMTKLSPAVREELLLTMIRIVRQTQSISVLSGVVHPLLKVLAGVKDRPSASNGWNSSQSSVRAVEAAVDHGTDAKLAALSALALLEIGRRTTRSFKVFVPVIAKALRASDLRRNNSTIYSHLRGFVLGIDPVLVGELLSEENMSNDENRSVLNKQDGEPDLSSALAFSLNGFGKKSRVPYERLNIQEGLRTQQIRVHVAENALAAKWDVSLNSRPEDWVNWMRSLGAAMFDQSGSPVFRACVRIAESYPPFTKQLFNAVFLSCWQAGLNQRVRNKICESLDAALVSKTIPLNVLQEILNLFEYMDHDEKPLPVATGKLAPTACKCGAFAKAIRYKEKEYSEHASRPDQLKEDICGEEGLISIYEKLGHIESAMGTIKDYQRRARDNVHEQWYEKLRKWDDALAVYEAEDVISEYENKMGSTLEAVGELYDNDRKWNQVLGRFRCLDQLGRWRDLNSLLQRVKGMCSGNIEAMQQLALYGKGVSVAFDLGRWDEFEEWVSYLSPDTFLGCFYNTLLSVKRGKDDPMHLTYAETFLRDARSELDLDLTARVSEAYQRAYKEVVNAQLLVELEEMIAFLRLCPEDAKQYGKKRLHSLWSERLKGCKQEVFTWYRLLMIRALVMKPIDTKDQWLEFATMCRKTSRLPMASEALRMLVASFVKDSPDQNKDSEMGKMELKGVLSGLEEWDTTSVMAIRDLDIKFACIKHMWAVDKRMEAYDALRKCQDEFLPELCSRPIDADLVSPIDHEAKESERTLAGEVFSKLSKWADRILENGPVPGISNEDPLTYAQRATEIRPDWYKAWHYWGVVNTSRFETLLEKEQQSISANDPSKKAWHSTTSIKGLRHGEPARKFFVAAVRGYFRAINLEGKTRLEDTLKVLTLWFNYGGHSNLHVEFDKCFRETNIAMWLEVVAQIIARLYSPVPGVQRGVKALMTRIGKEHPQIAVYPLTVAKSAVGSRQQQRRKAAADILDALRTHHPEIVEQSELVSTELIRSAILWMEKWYETLEEASKFYFVERDVEGMLRTLLPLHAEMEKGAETICEQEFIHEYGHELQEAGDLCRRFQIEHQSRETDEATLGEYLCQAWALYHHVFRKIQRQQQTMLVFDLAKISNRLHEARDLQLAVPGTYNSDKGAQVIGIQAFGSRLVVVQSKQRPRKISILGSNGRQYYFLLKGHEDLRQDERVMQVFRLVNKLFSKSVRKDLLSGVEMKTYSVIALSANAGLIEWVPDCDTLHALVKEYREARKIMPNIEHKVMLRIAPEPDRLPLLHKVDLFECMLQTTGSVDIAKVLWLKSRNSEVWLGKRNTYARSLATTSMTGYLLGLGDRHPSNLMIERSTGKVLHIDFGDCFEVAMKREKYPEKVPFRLTRMLVQALEPCGVDGYFRHTCEAAMDVLRQKSARESLMAMMEAFVYDPLIRWKLIGADELIQLREEEAAHAGDGKSNGNGTARSISLEGGNNPIVRSLRETGSLSESVRAMRHEERLASAQNAVESPEGAVPTPGANVSNAEDETDIATLQTPNEKARMEQRRALRDGDPTQQKITHVSNERAQSALNRFEHKLCGTDFDPNVSLDVAEQVDRLIKEAQSIENLCALFMGWCAFW